MDKLSRLSQAGFVLILPTTRFSSTGIVAVGPTKLARGANPGANSPRCQQFRNNLVDGAAFGALRGLAPGGLTLPIV
jgi:hypothetical protein